MDFVYIHPFLWADLPVRRISSLFLDGFISTDFFTTKHFYDLTTDSFLSIDPFFLTDSFTNFN